ncbi:MAG: amino acid ABC transporter permease, partial [Haliea sp.]
MGSVSSLLASYGPAFGQALLLTWKLTAISFVAGFVLGLVVTVLRLLPLPPLRVVLTVYVEIFRNIPSVALLIF